MAGLKLVSPKGETLIEFSFMSFLDDEITLWGDPIDDTGPQRLATVYTEVRQTVRLTGHRPPLHDETTAYTVVSYRNGLDDTRFDSEYTSEVTIQPIT